MIPSTTGADFSKLEPTGGESWALTSRLEGLRWKYHLRSQSGSNGPIAKETSPLLGWRPILSFGLLPDKNQPLTGLGLFSACQGDAASRVSTDPETLDGRLKKGRS